MLRWWPQLSAVLLILVELFWVVPWYRMVIRISYVASTVRVALVLGGIMAAAFAITRLMEKMRLLQGLQLAVLVILLGGGLLLAESLLLDTPAIGVINGLVVLNPGAVLVVFFVFWMWWRGITLARDPVRPIVAWRRFELGLLLFMAYLFIVISQAVVLTADEQPLGLLWFISFLFIGFLAVVFARVSYVGITKGVRKNPFDRRWFASTTGILGASILVAALLGGLLTGQYRMVLDALVDILRLLAGVALFIVSLPGLLLGMIAGPLLPWLMGLVSRSTPTPTVAVDGGFAPVIEMPAEAAVISPELRVGCFWAVMVLIVIVLLIRVRQRLAQRGANDLPEPESLLKRGEASQLLRKLVEETLDGLAARLRPAQRLLAAARVRRIYTQLLELCADLGYPRPVGRTPLEFLPDLGEIFPYLPSELSLITQAYVRIRYGQFPETQAEIDSVEQGWQKISQEGERLKKAGLGKLQTAEVKEIQRPGV